jgi:hypothetical protein
MMIRKIIVARVILDGEDARRAAKGLTESQLLSLMESPSAAYSVKPMLATADEIYKRFIKPHEATNPELEEIGYSLLMRLMQESREVGNVERSIMFTVAKGERHRRRSANGGKNKPIPGWEIIATPIAQEYVRRNPNYNKSELARHIDGKHIAEAPVVRQICTAIGKWQKAGLLPKKVGSQARFTT